MQTLKTAPRQMMTPESIEAYIEFEKARGAAKRELQRYRRFTQSLYDWLPEDKLLTRERLQSWREMLKDQGYSPATEQNYIKGINRYLDFIGCSGLRFQRGNRKDLTGQTFGYLTALEPTGEIVRKDRIWRCRCRCGAEVTYPATRLLTGNTRSCGCLRAEHLQDVNQYCDGTSLYMSMTERVRSNRARSGYTGVMWKRGKWKAYINYKGKRIDLGSYSRLEDAVKARAKGKAYVQEDAQRLLKVNGHPTDTDKLK